MNAFASSATKLSCLAREGIIMTVKLKLLAACAAVLLAACPVGGASAKSKRSAATPAAPEQPAAKQSVSPAVQIIPVKGVQPLTPDIEQALKPKDSFKECDSCPEMVVVPKGSFIMGTPMTEVDRYKGEDPLHRVSFARPFAVGRFTISFDEWDACLADGGCGDNKGDDKYGRGRMPAQGITYDAAKSYLAWLSRKVGRSYRLPSESEREYFTRAGTTTAFWFGNTLSSLNAAYMSSTPYANGPRGVDAKGPAVVDSYAPNPFGLYQVHGNVMEWTEDCFNKRYTEDTPADGAPWLEGDCTKHMVRGGLWNWSADKSRSGYRDDSYFGSGNSFRVARTLNVRP
jgi:formylglycine-generating enzyme required for sulfatase activity